MLWWNEWQGVVTAALILMQGEDGEPFLWYVDSTVTQRATITKKENQARNQWTVGVIDEAKPHTYKGCPLVRLQVDPDDSGQSQAGPIAESQKRIFILDSLLTEELHGATFTTTVLTGVAKTDVEGVTLGPGHFLCLPSNGSGTPGVTYIKADVSQATSLRDSLAYEMRELYRVAGLAPGNPTEVGQPESGVAKAFAFNEVEATLSGIADAAEHAENRVVWLIANAFWGGAYPGNANWPNEFQSLDLSAELETVIRLDSSNAPAILREKSWKAYGRAAFELNEDEAKTLDEQASEESQREQSSALDFPPGRNGLT